MAKNQAPRSASVGRLFKHRRRRLESRRRQMESASARQVERLEDRRVMAAFQFVSAYAQNGAPFFVAGSTAGTPELNEAPQQVTLRFSPGVTIDSSPASLSSISVSRSGRAGDGFGTSGTVADLPIVPGSIVVDDTPNGNQVILRFAENLPDDSYQIIIGAGLKSRAGDSLAQQVTLNVRLNLGASVVAVVPQPVTRGLSGSLSQSRDTVEVYFNRDDPLDTTSAQTVSLYRLIQMNAAGGDVGTVNPTGVAYDQATGKAVLTFATGAIVDDRLYRLEIGGAAAVTAAAAFTEAADAANSRFFQAQDLGALGAAGATVNGAVDVRPTVSTATGEALGIPAQPGTIDGPGHRDTPVDSGNHGQPVATVDPATGLVTIQYNFRDHYGDDPQGNPLHNVITEAQKQRAREIFELYSLYAGVRFVETADQGLTVATGDLRALAPDQPTTPAGLGGWPNALMNSQSDWGNSEFGGSWFSVAMHEIGHALGLQHSIDVRSIMGGGVPDGVYPGNYDIEHLRQLADPAGGTGRMAATSNDVDLYKFNLPQAGTLTAETFVARPGLPVTSLADTVISLYRQDAVTGLRTLIARNDNYYGRDSFLRLDLAAGTYYVAVTSTGNTDINPEVPDSGDGGRTEGAYQLKLGFTPATVAATTILDTSGVPLDGDRDGTAGGAFKFWFNTASTANTIYVDKANTTAGTGAGTLVNPYKTISAAFAAVGASTRVIRIAGNSAGTNGAPLPYLIGVDAFNRTLADGATFNVPKGVTVMVDAGAVFKLGTAVIDVGSSSSLVDRAGAALQVLGTPAASTVFTSLYDDTIGGISDGFAANAGPAATAGQWGGVVLRQDSDAASKLAFVNLISNATFRYGGGKVRVDGQLENFASIQMESTRPTVVFNTITNSAGAAIAATPNSFEDTTDRVGPEFRGNVLTGNSINGLFVKIDTQFGTPLEKLDVPARFKSTDLVYVIQENLVISGGVGGYELKVDPADGTEKPFARQSGRLTIDPGVVVKLQGARIELERGIAQLVAEGTAGKPVIFTSLGDNRYGAGGTFDTNGTLADKFGATGVVVGTLSTGDWGGIMLNAGSMASIDHAYVAFGGGQTPIEGSFDSFNVIETHQGDLRLASSRVEYNAAGTATTGRNGRGTNASATVFVNGAQPIIVGNDFRQNAGAVISINANSLSDASRPDAGRSTGAIDRFAQYDDNLGPLVRGNRLSYTPAAGLTAIAGMVIRGSEITVEGVWDDTDIVHVLQNEIIVNNFHTATSMRLVSRPDASLVVKLDGAAAGFTAAGFPLDIDDRIGGTVQVIGQAGYPVVLTSLRDDSVGASLDAIGQTVKDTNVDGTATTSAAGDWRSLRFESYSNDRNVAVVSEVEKPLTGGTDTNAATVSAQWLGVLAPNYPTGTASFDSAQEKSGDENRRIGFEVHGHISPDAPGDVDLYSFTGYPGSTVWIDVDKTAASLDSMVELLDASGRVLARSADAQSEGGVIQAERQADLIGGTTVTYQLDPGGAALLPDPGTFSVVAGTLNGTLYEVPAGAPPVAIQTFSFDSAGVVHFHNILGSDKYGAPLGAAGTAIGAATGGTLDLTTGQVTFTFNGPTGIGANSIEVRYAYKTTTFTTATLGIAQPLGQSAVNGADFQSLNPRDPGMCVILPGTQGTQTQYFVRVRSQKAYGVAPTQPQYEADLQNEMHVKDGASAGRYELRVRLQQRDEKPGSAVLYADIRYPTTGIDVRGLPRNSLLLGEVGENPTDANNTFANAQYIGNVLQSDRNAISVAASVATENDIDWYTFAVNYENIQAIPGINDSGQTFAAVLDLDYADGFRGDLSFAVFDEQGTLLYISRDSNIANDQPAAGQGTDFADLARASLGKLDPFLGTVTLGAGVPDGVNAVEDPAPQPDADPARQTRYYVAVFSNKKLPTQLDAMFNAGSANVAVRLEPLASVARVVNNGIGAAGPNTIVDTANLAAHVTPFTLSDVTLFVTTATGLQTVDAMKGGVETTINTGAYGGTSIGDLVMRSDGRLYAYTGVAANTATAGRLATVNAGDGTPATLGADGIPNLRTVTQTRIPSNTTLNPASFTFSLANPGIPDVQPQTFATVLTVTNRGLVINQAKWLLSGPTVVPLGTAVGTIFDLTITPIDNAAGLAAPVSATLNTATGIVTVTWASVDITNPANIREFIELETTNYDLRETVTTDVVDAVAWERTGVGQYANLYYSVRDGVNSRLYRANPATGSAAVATGQPWGRVGYGFIQDAGNQLGIVTGMTYAGATLYGVDDLGHFFTIDPATAVASNVITIAGAPAFAGLAIGPQNLYDGTLANVLFAIDAGGTLRALSTAGVLQTVFDAVDAKGNPGSDGIADATEIATGAAGVTGLAFSPLDINLWHDTGRRADGGGTPMYFGLENTAAQFGANATWQADLLSNPAIANTYNLPGGAYGSLTTDSFSLDGYDYTDKPTLYFSYWLQTDDAAGTGQDRARAFVSIDGGLTWELLATNSNAGELPAFASVSSRITGGGPNAPGGNPVNQKVQQLYDTANWRQVRVDLGEFAGRADVRLRFDFTTAGVMDATAVWRTTKTVAAAVAAATDVTFADVSNLTDPNLVLTLVARDGMVLGNVLNIDLATNTVTLDTAITLAAGDIVTFVDAAGGNLLNDIIDNANALNPPGPQPGIAATAGNFTAATRGQNNQFEGFYIDRIIVGFAERGEAVTNAAAAQTGFTDLTMPATPVQVLAGAYQLEVRRGTELAVGDVTQVFDTNDPLVSSRATNAGFGARIGDPNQPRQQGQLLIQSNIISNAANYGISIDAAGRDDNTNAPIAGVPRNFATLNASRLAPGAVVMNNVIAGSGTGGILFSGDPNAGNVPLAAVPFGRIINNTIYGGGVETRTASTTATSAVVTVATTAGLAVGMTVTGAGIPAATTVAAVTNGTTLTLSRAATATATGVTLTFRNAAAIATGVAVTENAGPTLLNNIFANLGQGVRIDGTSAANTVVGMSAYWNTATQVTGVAESGQLVLTADPFVNAKTGNFYLVEGSRAIDSALGSLQDRANYRVVTSPLGISVSPIIAPERDLYGQLRGDDPTVAPPSSTQVPGLGRDVFQDRGAIDRVDFAQPWVALLNPFDQGVADQNPATDAVVLTKADARGITQFTLQLNDVGVGIDKATVMSTAFTLTRNGTPLVDGVNYLFRYLESSNQVVFEADSVYSFGSYAITVNQTVVGGAFVNMIADLAGNPLLPNQADGTTALLISLDDVPGIPTNLSATSGDLEVPLTWTAPLSNGQSPVTDYQVQYTTDGSNWITFTDGVAATPGATVTGLANGTPYSFRVRAVNAIGAGDWSNVVGPIVPLPIPAFSLAVDTGVSATDGITSNGLVNVTNVMPAAAWQYSVDNGVTWSAPQLSTTTTFTLPANATYAAGAVRVRQTVGLSRSGEGSNAAPITVDTIAPVAAPLTAVTDDAPLFTGSVPDGGVTNDAVLDLAGTTEDGTLVEVFDGATKLGNATVIGTTWTFATPSLTNGVTYVFKTRATDRAGNVGPDSATRSVTVDTAAPAAPTIVSVTDDVAPAAGPVSSGGFTNDQVLVLSGTTDNGTTVEILDGATKLGDAVVVGTTWTFTTAALVNGVTYAFKARPTDLAGNVGPDSATHTVAIDTVAPPAPTITSVVDDVAPTIGSVPSGGVTNDRVLVLSGTAAVGTAVAIFDGTTKLGDATVVGAAWTFTTGQLVTGTTYTFTALAADAASNVSPASDPYSVTIDTVAPAVTAFGTDAAAGAYGIGAVIRITATMSEVVQAGSTLLVTLNSGAVVSLVAATQGSTLSGTYTVADGQNAAQLAVVSMNASGVRDFADNVAVSTLPGTNLPAGIRIDGTAPVLVRYTSTTADGTYGISAAINITANTSESVRAGSTMTVTLSTGARVTLVAATAGTTLSGTYVVQAGQSTADLDVVSVNTLSVLDLAGNAVTVATGGLGTLAAARAIVVRGVISIVTPPGFSINPAVVPDRRGAVTSIPIVFNTPVTGFTLANITLRLGIRTISLSGAKLTGSGANYVLTIPAKLTSLKGIYTLRIAATGIVAVNGAPMTGTTSIYWGNGRRVG